MRVSLCLLVWNELEGCKFDVPQLPSVAFEEVYAVDGGSTDGTVEYLGANGIAVYPQPTRGLNAAYWHGINVSSCEAVVFFFPKGTIPVADLVKFRPLLESGCHLVIASRNIAGAKNEEDDRVLKPRKWLVLSLAIFAALIWRREGYWVRDVLHGVRAITVDGFRRMAPSDVGLSIDIETVIGSYRLRLKRAEFPTCETPRPFGRTHFKIFPTSIKLGKYLWREFWRAGPSGEA
jgi:glycosyltransferase involved in cell wall biosynthesis